MMPEPTTVPTRTAVPKASAASLPRVPKEGRLLIGERSVAFMHRIENMVESALWRVGARCYALRCGPPFAGQSVMQKPFLATIVVVGFLGAPALATDMPRKATNTTPIEAPPYNWSGPYVGVNFGGGWTNGGLNIPGNNLYGGVTELIGGVQAGYNVQAGHVLFGVEGDFDGASFNHPALPAPTLGSVDQHWTGTVGGRFGLVNDRWLVFGKFGGGWVQSNAMVNVPGSSWSGSGVNTGWLFGGGIEYGFKPNWTQT
jgi:opacity protein-like surface antigen